MSWNIVSLDDIEAAPWRNGGGVTRELLTWPGADEWRIRMSVAEVEQDGPFSRFDGVQRWFAVLAGAGVRLRPAGATHELTTDSDPFRFDGGAATDCELIAGATQDFNLMLRGASGGMGRVRGAHSLDCSAGELIAVFAGSAKALAVFDGEEFEIGRHTLAWRILDAGGPLRIAAQDALWMEIEP